MILRYLSEYLEVNYNTYIFVEDELPRGFFVFSWKAVVLHKESSCNEYCDKTH